MAKIDLNKRTILVTGSSGFIGSNLCRALFEQFVDITIIGIDNMNDYYDVSLKEYRLAQLQKYSNYTFIKGDISDKTFIAEVFEQYHPSVVVNLAAQAGVRYSITNPDAYIQSNIIGFFNILEACRYSYDNEKTKVEHLVYASSSSVYGSNKKVPYSTDDKVDNPVSLYAATKKSNELLAHSYSKLYGFPSTGLRFFTVYGPAGRPDMAYFKFTNKIVKGEKIQIYNNGDMKRDFTYIDDIVKGIIAVMQKIPELTDDGVPYKVYNIGNSQPEDLLTFVNTLEECLKNEGIITEPVEKEFLPMQPGDVYQTFADTSELEKTLGFKPETTIRDGLTIFAKWYKSFYGDKL